MMLCSKSSFQGRVGDVPFMLNIGEFFRLKNKGVDPDIMAHKKLVKNTFTLLHLHPCYIVNILKSGKLDFEA